MQTLQKHYASILNVTECEANIKHTKSKHYANFKQTLRNYNAIINANITETLCQIYANIVSSANNMPTLRKHYANITQT